MDQRPESARTSPVVHLTNWHEALLQLDHATPIRKGKLGKPTEFGYVAQIAEVTPNTSPLPGNAPPPAG